MAPSFETALDALPDELLQNVLGRLLWRPDYMGPGKVRQRVWLEAVSKRFQKVVAMSGTLEWDLTESAKSEEGFKQYVLARAESMAPLEKLGIRFKGKPNVIDFLLLTVPQALETLRQVRIICIDDRLGDDAYPEVAWNTVIFRLLSTCRRLESFEVFLWGGLRTLPPLKLDPITSPVTQSESLSLLLLYGFSIPRAHLAPFIQHFLPNLKTLELHTDLGDVCLESTSLEKLFLWGNDGEGFDTANPGEAAVPESLTVLLNMLISGDAELRNCVLIGLHHLLANSDSVREVVVQIPWLVPKLLCWLKFEEAVAPSLVVDVLLSLWKDEQARELLGGDPKTLLALVNFVIEQESGYSGSQIASFLADVFAEAETQKLLASNASCVKRLVGFAIWNEKVNASVVEKAVKILASLSPEAKQYLPRKQSPMSRMIELISEQREKVRDSLGEVLDKVGQVQTHGVVEGILEVLNAMHWFGGEFDRAASLLLRLVSTAGVRESVAEIPGCLEILVGLLEQKSSRRRRPVVQILQSLSEDADVAKRIADVSGCLPLLVRCLGNQQTNTDDVKGSAARALCSIAEDEKHREEIAALPEVVPMLMEMLVAKPLEPAMGLGIGSAVGGGVGELLEKGKGKLAEEGVASAGTKFGVTGRSRGELMMAFGPSSADPVKRPSGEPAQGEGESSSRGQAEREKSWADMQAAAVALLGRLGLAHDLSSINSSVVGLLPNGVSAVKRSERASVGTAGC